MYKGNTKYWNIFTDFNNIKMGPVRFNEQSLPKETFLNLLEVRQPQVTKPYMQRNDALALIFHEE